MLLFFIFTHSFAHTHTHTTHAGGREDCSTVTVLVLVSYHTRIANTFYSPPKFRTRANTPSSAGGYAWCVSPYCRDSSDASFTL